MKNYTETLVITNITTISKCCKRTFNNFGHLLTKYELCHVINVHLKVNIIIILK